MVDETPGNRGYYWNNNAPRHIKMTLGRNPTKIVNDLNTSLISNRKDYRTAIHLITGHCGLNKHLKKITGTTRTGTTRTGTKRTQKNASFVDIKKKLSLTFSANVQLLPSSEDATSTTTTSLSMTFSVTFTSHQPLALLLKPTDFSNRFLEQSNLKTSTTQE